MIQHKFRVGITIDDSRGNLNVYITDYSDGVRSVALPLQMVFSQIDEGMLAEPAITCSWEYGIPLLKALRDAIDRFDGEMCNVLG